jgi:hypothetical protein
MISYTHLFIVIVRRTNRSISDSTTTTAITSTSSTITAPLKHVSLSTQSSLPEQTLSLPSDLLLAKLVKNAISTCSTSVLEFQKIRRTEWRKAWEN